MLTPLRLCEHLARVAGLNFAVLRRRADICVESGLFPDGDAGGDEPAGLNSVHCWLFIVGLLAARRAEDTAVAVHEYGQLLPVKFEDAPPFAPGVSFGRIGAFLIEQARDPSGRAIVKGRVDSLSCLRSTSVARLILLDGNLRLPYVQFYQPQGRIPHDVFRYTTVMSMEAAATSALIIGLADLLDAVEAEDRSTGRRSA